MRKFAKKETKDKMDADHRKIEELREQARDYIKKNNALVEQLWDIDRQLLDTEDEAEKEALHSRQKQLQNTLKDHGYESEIQKLLGEIKALETKVDGQSDIGSSSPYEL